MDLDQFETRARKVVAHHPELLQAYYNRLISRFAADRLVAFLDARLKSVFRPRLLGIQELEALNALTTYTIALLALGHQRALDVVGGEGAYRQQLRGTLDDPALYPPWSQEAPTEESVAVVADGGAQPAAQTAHAPHAPVIDVDLSPQVVHSLEEAIARGVASSVPSAVAAHAQGLHASATAAAENATRNLLSQAEPRVAAAINGAAQAAVDQALPALASVASGHAEATLRAAGPQLEAYIEGKVQPLLHHIARMEAAQQQHLARLEAAQASLAASLAAASLGAAVKPPAEEASRPGRGVIPEPASYGAGLPDDEPDDLDRLFAQRTRGHAAPALRPNVFLQGARVLATLADAGVGTKAGATGAARALWEQRVIAELPQVHREEAERAFEYALAYLEGGRLGDNPELARRINADLSRWGISAYAGVAQGKRAAAFLDDTGGPSLEVRRALHATALASGAPGDRARAAAFGSAPTSAEVERAAVLDFSRPKMKGQKKGQSAASPPAKNSVPDGQGNGKGREGK